MIVYFVVVLILPIIFTYLCKKYKFLSFIGNTICCFLIGIIAGNIFSSYDESIIKSKIIEEIINVIVPLGIIIMLLNTNVKLWFRLSLKMIFSYLLGVIGVVICSVSLFYAFGQTSPYHHVAGMLAGTYIGGTPNMTAITKAVNASELLYAQLFITDSISSAIYLVFVMIIGQRVLNFILPKYKNSESSSLEYKEEKNSFSFNQNVVFSLISIIIGIVIFGITISIYYLIFRELKTLSMLYVVLSVTILAVAFSFSSKIRTNPMHYPIGEYLFNLFFAILGTKTLFSDILNIESSYLIFTFITLFGAFSIHILLGKIFKIDTDTLIVTSAAGIMSPPFIPSICNSIKNKDLIAPGIAVGILGLAMGNLVGITIVLILEKYIL